MASTSESLVIRDLGLQEYEKTWIEMREFTASRSEYTSDEFWLLQHPPVYTQGMNCSTQPTADAPADIPVVSTDRGGQMTYHGPGQAIAYVLIDLRRRGLGPRHMVGILEQGVIDLLADYGIQGQRRAGAPGVYVADAKIAALGLRVRRGGSYHGVSLNVDMNLNPFEYIDPCGFEGLRVTQLKEQGVALSCSDAAFKLAGKLTGRLGYHTVSYQSDRKIAKARSKTGYALA